MKPCNVIATLIFVLLGCQTKNNLPEIKLLESNWQFKKQKDTIWYSANVPGSVHTDLMSNGLIENPFIGDNESGLQWISDANWEYKTRFTVGESLMEKNNLRLTFDGLDTYASLYLNDSLILKTSNAFRQYQVDVKSLIKTHNELKIVFESTSIHESKAASNLSYTLPEGPRIFTRKAQFQYGWDWGPKLNTFGIWRPITLEGWDFYKIEDIYVKQKSLSDSKANLEIRLEEHTHFSKPLTYNVYINDTLYKSFQESPSNNLTLLPVQITDPKRWWPHNIGEPNLYNIKVVVKSKKTLLDSISTNIGLRTVELITKKDSIGESFYFKVNSIPVYAKGANYIPQHSFQNKIGTKQYNQLLDDVVNANMNTLRVWGGGIYEADEFYELCDEKGIMIWQDFMFACAMYPGDSSFLNNVQEESVQNVKRLGDHPSLILWCGNNESSEGWHRWGWKENRDESEIKEIWTNYLKVFDSILPNAVEQYSDIPYWESSPKYGRGNPNYETQGDAHDWWVWHDAYPFEHFENNVPRFVSEFGFQSFPNFETIHFINQSETLNIESEEFNNHQKHKKGFDLIRKYMERDFPVPSSPDYYVYVSQLVQAYGIVKGIEAQRRSRPYCMGSLYWQLNDCWPSISWSSIDFSGNWKALHYSAKTAFDNIMISSEIKANKLVVYIVNDNLEPVKDSLSLTLKTFDGSIIWKKTRPLTIAQNSSQKATQLDLDTVAFNPRTSFLMAEFHNKQKPIYFVNPKGMKLANDTILKKITKYREGYKIELSCKTLQKNLYLYSKIKGRFSDNYFDLFPHETKVVLMETNADTLNDLKIMTLNKIQFKE